MHMICIAQCYDSAHTAESWTLSKISGILHDWDRDDECHAVTIFRRVRCNKN